MKTTLLTAYVAASLALRAHAYLDIEDGAFDVRHLHIVERSEDGDIVGRAIGSTYSIVGRDEDTGLFTRGRDCQLVSYCGTPGGCMSMAPVRSCKGEDWKKGFNEAIEQTGAIGRTGLKIMAEGIGRGPVGTIIGAAKATTKAVLDAKKQQAERQAAEAQKRQSKKSAPKKKAPAKRKPAKRTKTPAKKHPKMHRGPAKKAPGKARQPVKKSRNGRGPVKKKLTPKGPAAKRTAAPRKATPKKAPVKNKKTKRDLEDLEDEVLNRRDFDVIQRDEDMNLIERAEYSLFNMVTRDENDELVVRECEMYNGEVSCM